VRVGAFLAGLSRACRLTVLSSSTPPPVGETTLLFTDIEGSTRLARALGPDWPDVVDDHHRLLESAIVGCGGHVERAAGDSFLALFIDPVQAVQAAVDAQRSLARHQWPHQTGGLRVRMGVHTGSVGRGVRGLIGLDLHLAARVQAAAHGGQILITQTTRHALANNFSVKGLGLHRLKDFPEPERLFQVVVDGRGPAVFPPVRTDGPPTKGATRRATVIPRQPVRARAATGNPRPCRLPTIQPPLRARSASQCLETKHAADHAVSAGPDESIDRTTATRVPEE
jgi:class 3 adenylate cyclase